MNRFRFFACALAVAIAAWQPAAAPAADMSAAASKCSASDPLVMMNTKTETYVVVNDWSNSAGSLSYPEMPAAYVQPVCKSEAEHDGAKPAFEGSQMHMDKMLMALGTMNLTPNQRAAISSAMRTDSMQMMSAIHSTLTDAQKAQLDQVMRQMSFPSP